MTASDRCPWINPLPLKHVLFAGLLATRQVLELAPNLSFLSSFFFGSWRKATYHAALRKPWLFITQCSLLPWNWAVLLPACGDWLENLRKSGKCRQRYLAYVNKHVTLEHPPLGWRPRNLPLRLLVGTVLIFGLQQPWPLRTSTNSYLWPKVLHPRIQQGLTILCGLQTYLHSGGMQILLASAAVVCIIAQKAKTGFY